MSHYRYLSGALLRTAASPDSARAIQVPNDRLGSFTSFPPSRHVQFDPTADIRPKPAFGPRAARLVRPSYATEFRFVAATALLPMWSRSFSTSFTRPWLTS